MSDFSLRNLIREVIAESDSADPGALAGEVFDKIPRKHIGDALQEALRGYVRVIVAADRSPAGPAHEHAGDPTGTRPVSPGRSWKRDAIRQGWKARLRDRLRDRLHVGPDATAWKLLGQCTYDDLMFAAQERRTAAERTLARAGHYEELAKLLKDHAVSTVGELPDEALEAQLGDEKGDAE